MDHLPGLCVHAIESVADAITGEVQGVFHLQGIVLLARMVLSSLDFIIRLLDHDPASMIIRSYMTG
jgi:hypothetical protein